MESEQYVCSLKRRLLMHSHYRCVDGKCGICGEPYDKPVKLFEKGGAMYTGKIVKTYTQGQQIDVKVMVCEMESIGSRSLGSPF